MKNNLRKGFTLLEMLVVISIIGVLLGVGSVAYSTTQKKARDAKRKSDLKAIQNCLEQYYSLNNVYEVIGNPGDVVGIIQCGDTKTLEVTDPLNSDPQTYSIETSTETEYKINSTLETNSEAISVSNLQ